MYITTTRVVNLGLPKAFIQLFHMQAHIPYIQARRDVLLFYPTLKQLVPKLQHVISKTVTLMCKASSVI